MLFPNIAQAHTPVAHAVTATYEHPTYDLAKTESEGSEKVAKSAPVGCSSASTCCNTIIQEQSLSGHKNASFSSIV